MKGKRNLYQLSTRRKLLESQLAKQERRAAEAEAELTAGRHREQALLDICRRLEDVMHIRQQHVDWQLLQQAQPASGDTSALQEQQPPPLDVPAVLRAVPAYCCTSHLLRSASLELVQAATSLSTSQWSELFSAVVNELTVALELLTPQQEQQAAAQHQAAHRAGRKPPPPAAGSEPGSPVDPHSDGSSDAAAAPAAGACTVQQQPPAAYRQGCSSDAPPSAGDGLGCSKSAMCEVLLRGIVGAACVSAALQQPSPACNAAVLNHRTQRLRHLEAQLLVGQRAELQNDEPGQVAPREAPEPPGHWLSVVARLNLTPDQAGYLAACGKEVARMLSSQHGELQRMFPLACTPGLQVLAAEAQAATQAPSGAPGGDERGCSVAAVAGCVSQMSALPAVLLSLCFDCLSLQQGALLLCSSYPWFPRPLPVASAAGELLAAQPSGAAQPAAGGAPLPPPLEVQQRHLQEARAGWWVELMRALPATAGADARPGIDGLD